MFDDFLSLGRWKKACSFLRAVSWSLLIYIIIILRSPAKIVYDPDIVQDDAWTFCYTYNQPISQACGPCHSNCSQYLLIDHIPSKCPTELLINVRNSTKDAVGSKLSHTMYDTNLQLTFFLQYHMDSVMAYCESSIVLKRQQMQRTPSIFMIHSLRRWWPTIWRNGDILETPAILPKRDCPFDLNQALDIGQMIPVIDSESASSSSWQEQLTKHVYYSRPRRRRRCAPFFVRVYWRLCTSRAGSKLSATSYLYIVDARSRAELNLLLKLSSRTSSNPQNVAFCSVQFNYCCCCCCHRVRTIRVPIENLDTHSHVHPRSNSKNRPRR